MKSLSAALISSLLAVNTISAHPAVSSHFQLSTRGSDTDTNFERIPFSYVSFTSAFRRSAIHPQGWSTDDVTSFLDRAAANMTAVQGGADNWAVVSNNKFVYSESSTTQTEFSLKTLDDVQAPRPLVWLDVQECVKAYRNHVLAQAKSDPSARHSIQYFSEFVGNEKFPGGTFQAQGYFGDAGTDSMASGGPATTRL